MFCFLTVNLIFPSSIWRFSLAASKLRSWLLSFVTEINPPRSSFSTYWRKTQTQRHMEWHVIPKRELHKGKDNYKSLNLSLKLTQISEITYISVSFVIEEEECVSTQARPQFPRCLHTENSDVKSRSIKEKHRLLLVLKVKKEKEEAVRLFTGTNGSWNVWMWLFRWVRFVMCVSEFVTTSEINVWY